MGRVTSVTQNGNSMTYTYDKLGLLVTKQDFEGNDTIYEYNYRCLGSAGIGQSRFPA